MRRQFLRRLSIVASLTSSSPLSLSLMIWWRYSCWLTKCDLYLLLDISPVGEREWSVAGARTRRQLTRSCTWPTVRLGQTTRRPVPSHKITSFPITTLHTHHHLPLHILNNISHITPVAITQLPLIVHYDTGRLFGFKMIFWLSLICNYYCYFPLLVAYRR